MKVIAEGVETQLQRDLLATAGCDYAQGYFYARPMSEPDFEAFVADYTKRTPV
jgi:EAL domain-containing protein (putative c-di-GMP-specific phosphodiesterase class I)